MFRQKIVGGEKNERGSEFFRRVRWKNPAFPDLADLTGFAKSLRLWDLPGEHGMGNLTA